MKKILLLYVLAIVLQPVLALETETFWLSGTDKDRTVAWEFFCSKGMNSGRWSSIAVPSQWEQQGFGAYNYGQGDPFHDETGQYRFHFNALKSWKNRVIEIVFEGSMTDTEVRINGQSAGPVHRGGFYPFRYDITDKLLYGKDNLLEVTVSKESADASINRAERRGDYWDFGGIYRPVYLEILPKSRMERVAIDARADGTFRAEVALAGIRKNCLLTGRLETMDGKTFGQPLSMAVSQKANTAVLTGFFQEPACWTPETPNLYRVVLTLKSGKTELHRLTKTVGFRTVEVRPNDGIYVNGTKIRFKGVCRHTFWPESGRCSSKERSIADVNTIKDMNMNAVRMSHYPPDQHFLDACDSLGLFVLDELAGWQAYYSTETGKRLVKTMMERDVNHPCIVLWDNGNEGGFNPELREEYAKYDPQKRVVIEPWSKINGTDTKHYPGYRYLENALTKGNLITFPTEFLHGLYDGGHGAGLSDYWKLMQASPLSAGGFLWVLADEGVVRRDKNDSIDNHGNNAPDGILGPHHEKEASFYTIRDLWSPVQAEWISATNTIRIVNQYLYRSLTDVRLEARLVKYSGIFPNLQEQSVNVFLPIWDTKPGNERILKPFWPADWRSYDVLCLKASESTGRLLNEWTWNLSGTQDVTSKMLPKKDDNAVSTVVETDRIRLHSGKVSVEIDAKTGLLVGVRVNDRDLPFGNGPVFMGDTLTFKSIRFTKVGNEAVVDVRFAESPDCWLKWTFLESGVLQLDYQYQPTGKQAFAGIGFDFPENLVEGVRLLADGPYRVWKNRLDGTTFGLWDKTYNNTITGQTWEYPEFKGYYANFHAVQVRNRVQPFNILTATPDLFLQLYTPGKPAHVKGDVYPAFPKSGISILNGIPAIGTKFSKAEEEGPHSRKNDFGQPGTLLNGRIFLTFDN
jgi:hypothetical protein